MKKLQLLIILAVIMACTLARPQDVKEKQEELQNRAAKYKFAHTINDKISDLTNQRIEEREGLVVKGSYSYSDGYYNRVIHYIADENGYRITRMEVTPLNGPKVDFSGTASVESAAHGKELAYKIQSIPVEGSNSSQVLSS